MTDAPSDSAGLPAIGISLGQIRDVGRSGLRDRRFPVPAEVLVHGIDEQLIKWSPRFDSKYLPLAPCGFFDLQRHFLVGTLLLYQKPDDRSPAIRPLRTMKALPSVG